VRRYHAIETKAQRGRVPAQREFDGLTGQGLSLALQQQLGGLGSSVATPAWAAGGIAGATLFEWAPSLFLLFLQEIISRH